MAKTKEIFLSRNGKVYGPVSSDQLERLKTSGELLNYRYWWDPNANSWQAVEPPPPEPAKCQVEAALVGMPAVCHDFGLSMVAGVIENVTEEGCHLVCTDGRELPGFGEDSKLTLNLADTATGRSLNVKAMLRGVWRKGQAWVYRLAWEKPPTFG